MDKAFKELRERKIVELRKQGMGITQIGEYFGVSRQRIDQIASKLPIEERNLFHHFVKPFLNLTCKNCGKTFQHKDSKRRNCSTECAKANLRKYATKDECRIATNERHRRLYNTDPEHRARIRRYQDAYNDRVNADPIRRAHKLQVMREYGRQYKRNKNV